MDASVELVKRGAMEPAELVSWIADKKGDIVFRDGINWGQEYNSFLLSLPSSREAVLHLHEIWL